MRARVSEVGWTAEFAIPFRTLRYPGGERQTWGINVQRNIRHRNERSFWAPLARQFNLNRLSLAGQLQGIEVPAQRNLKLTPYVLGEAVRSTARHRTVGSGDVGADLKYSITPSLTLDLTYNTDFAQVEVDEEQINLDRFNLFFPEKRPFFLENAGLFSIGRPGQIELFFSRRIGISDAGEQVPIIGGARLSGKVGNDTNVGFLNMQTAAFGGDVASQNFTVARVRQDLPSRSNVGAMVVSRQGTGNLAGTGDYNRTFAVDGRFGIGQSGTLSGFASETETPGGSAVDTHAFGVTGEYENENTRLNVRYTEVGPNFNPEVGFYQRRGYRRMDATIFTFFRPDNFIGIHELRPHVARTTRCGTSTPACTRRSTPTWTTTGSGRAATRPTRGSTARARACSCRSRSSRASSSHPASTITTSRSSPSTATGGRPSAPRSGARSAASSAATGSG